MNLNRIRVAHAVLENVATTVTVLIPTYNRVRLLERAVQSVLDQTFQDFEIIIIDDGSTDDTTKVIREYQSRDERIILLRHEKNLGQHLGFPKVLNLGLQRASGEYIARLDDDDYWRERTKLAQQVELLKSHPECVVVGTGMIVVDADGKELFYFMPPQRDWDIRKRALFSNPIAHPTAVYRRDAALAVGLYDEKLPFAEDWEFWLRLGTVGKLANLPVFGTCFRFSGRNQTFRYQRAQAVMVLAINWRYRKRYPSFVSAFLFNFFRLCYSLFPSWFKLRIQSIVVQLRDKLASTFSGL